MNKPVIVDDTTVRFQLASEVLPGGRTIERWVDVRVDDDKVRVIASHALLVTPHSSNVLLADVGFHRPLPPCVCDEGLVPDRTSRNLGKLRGCRRCSGAGVVRPHRAEVEP